MQEFDYSLNYKATNFREHPELYRIGRGEQGVFKVEPYKSEMLPHWRFATSEAARESSKQILDMFFRYLDDDDFVGADMARKFLQMGFTRARRYANYPGGRKYDGPVPESKKGQSGAHGRPQLPRKEDPVKAESARVFKEAWDVAAKDARYLALRQQHRDRYE